MPIMNGNWILVALPIAIQIFAVVAFMTLVFSCHLAMQPLFSCHSQTGNCIQIKCNEMKKCLVFFFFFLLKTIMKSYNTNTEHMHDK